ncbi:Isoquinoline 1-oxidoreductase subunit [Aurantimonas sp. HBX-1]|uniref:Isoquinoline 1-oxidoreductase subunit n=1 Tax=Aurantimonas sp. HBX-1 TaxID=2906072 RepID=UPI001F1A7E03|nr:Isoquinoline 1-oxidoreductase subunit [Aurantimonas sp. HBX-1]UIJ71274.1 Isoquinoline 1-oxidoreductase subunit [Aurantimonas sp. HBX-1]
MTSQFFLAGRLTGIALAFGLSAGTAFAQERAPDAPEPSTPAVAAQPADAPSLRPVSDFDNIADEAARSVAIFEETGKVLLHPRCVNCHPAGNSPLQGMEMRQHQPPVERGEANFGAIGMQCNTCHGPENAKVVAQAEGIKSIPGNPNWHLAPIEMAWEGRSLGEICEQIKDVDRNGGKTLAELVEHMAADDLVGWGWEPGAGREKVPGTQEQFGALYEAWAATGAHCPAS